MLIFDKACIEMDGFGLCADLALEPGSRNAVIGPSGAGKSTLLSMLAGFVPLSSGRITWQGRDLAPIAPGKRPVSILFQSQNLFPHLSAAQNVGMGLRPDLRLGAAQREQVTDALAQVGLAGMGPRKPASLSGGQQSRVALARIMLQDRPILLLDEPFSALGPALKHEMLDLLTGIVTRSGAMAVMVTHDPDDARYFAPQTIVVSDGHAAPPLPTEPLLDNPPDALRAYLGMHVL